MVEKYLNTASTYYKFTNALNPSDIAYDEVIEGKMKLEEISHFIKQKVNAPVNARVIYNSGATESIATCIHWAKTLNPYNAVIMGTEFDHPSVGLNCDNYDVKYKKSMISSKILDDRTTMVFLTQVNGKTGEILDIDIFRKNLDLYSFLDSETEIKNENMVLQYKPLFIVDISQSYNKLEIDMEKWDADAIFTSLHKIGGPIGTGFMVIKNPENFKPLIAGYQQEQLRGGTFSMEAILNFSYIFTKTPKPLSNKRWKRYYKYFRKHNINVYKPRGRHLNNTFLIKIKQNCPLNIINKLYNKGILVGTSSACTNEIKNEESHSYIRISFNEKNDLNKEILDKIIKAIKAI